MADDCFISHPLHQLREKRVEAYLRGIIAKKRMGGGRGGGCLLHLHHDGPAGISVKERQ